MIDDSFIEGSSIHRDIGAPMAHVAIDRSTDESFSSVSR